MSQRRPNEILALVAIFGLMPLAFVFLVLLPVKKGMETDRARLDAALQRNQSLPNIQPLTSQERALLEDPHAAWRTRIPLIASDAQRLAHYDRVVTGLQHAVKARGVDLLGVRSRWDSIKGSYTLSTMLGAMPGEIAPGTTSEQGQLQGWVLEAQLGGTPADVFSVLEALPGIDPLLEPVGLRWETLPEERKQMIILRNMVLIP